MLFRSPTSSSSSSSFLDHSTTSGTAGGTVAIVSSSTSSSSSIPSTTSAVTQYGGTDENMLISCSSNDTTVSGNVSGSSSGTGNGISMDVVDDPVLVLVPVPTITPVKLSQKEINQARKQLASNISAAVKTHWQIVSDSLRSHKIEALALLKASKAMEEEAEEELSPVTPSSTEIIEIKNENIGNIGQDKCDDFIQTFLLESQCLMEETPLDLLSSGTETPTRMSE